MTFMVVISLVASLSFVLGRIGINVYFARKCNEQHWKRVFYAKAFAILFIVWADLFVIALLHFARRADRREHVERDVNHWCGYYIQLAISGLTILSVVMLVLLH